MDLENFEKRQAVTAWRDRLQLSAWVLVNEASNKARSSLEQKLHEAGIHDSLWDPSHFARTRIDAAMRESLEVPLRNIFAQAAEELYELDSAYKSLSDVLTSSVDQLNYPSMAMSDDKRDQSTAITARLVPVKQRLSLMANLVKQRVVSKGVLEWGAKALGQIGEVADAAVLKVQNNTGLHDRLRCVAVERIERAWMSDRGDHSPLMAQIVAAVDKVTNQTRSLAS